MGFGWIYQEVWACMQFHTVGTGCDVMGIDMLVFLEGRIKGSFVKFEDLCGSVICSSRWYYCFTILRSGLQVNYFHILMSCFD